MAEETTHLCPPEGSGLMPCCNRTPFEVPRSDRMTLDRALVTCAGIGGLLARSGGTDTARGDTP